MTKQIFQYNSSNPGGTEYMVFNFHKRILPYLKNITKYYCVCLPGPVDFEKIKTRIKQGSTLDPKVLGNQYTLSVPDPNNVKVENGFIEVERGPAGCMLIKRSVIDTLIKEYPEFTIKQHTLIDGKLVTREHMYNFFDTYWDPKEKTYTGEDFYFCKLAKHAGIRMYALVDEYISHHGEYSYTGRLVDEFKKNDTSTQIEGKIINSDIDPSSLDIAKSK